ncbi:ankyrin repeat and SOCS box protein 2-like [Harmonia axyridis]|uniref:ankyrin repeat and SOCS box protein 2-like n=1 Tax=Harmonia axyridis TaxID=115357 RepID=UPI001E2785B2|nr:ankyrin repeat and SOCS box protein 2-like [Harmonia axyridis]
MRILKFAIELRFKPKERSFRYLNTALHIAVTHKRMDITRYLLDNGADVEAYNIFWETPLFSAIKSKKIEQAIILLQYGAEIDSRNRDDNTVLHILCSQEEGIDMEMCEFLIDCGLNPNLTGKFVQTSLHMLAKNNKAPHVLDCAKLSIEKGVDVNSKNVFGETALQNLAD